MPVAGLVVPFGVPDPELELDEPQDAPSSATATKATRTVSDLRFMFPPGRWAFGDVADRRQLRRVDGRMLDIVQILSWCGGVVANHPRDVKTSPM